MRKDVTLQPKKLCRYPSVHVIDAYFADDLALLTDSLTNAQDLLRSLENAVNSVGLYLNEIKTEYIPILQQQQQQHVDTVIKSLSRKFQVRLISCYDF